MSNTSFKKDSGEVVINESERIGPQTTKKEFLDSSIGKSATLSPLPESVPEGHVAYTFHLPTDSELIFDFMVSFTGEKIVGVSFGYEDEGSRNPSSENVETLKKLNDAWLEKQIGVLKADYSWGTIQSFIDNGRSPFAAIVIEYK